MPRYEVKTTAYCHMVIEAPSKEAAELAAINSALIESFDCWSIGIDPECEIVQLPDSDDRQPVYEADELGDEIG